MMIEGEGDDGMAFDSYCIVCDRRISLPKQPDAEDVKMTKKKSAGGTIRVGTVSFFAQAARLTGRR
jgi:hypothetical protein